MYSFSPVWIFWWIWRLVLLTNLFPQWAHTYGLSPVRSVKWTFREHFVERLFPQSWQINLRPFFLFLCEGPGEFIVPFLECLAFLGCVDTSAVCPSITHTELSVVGSSEILRKDIEGVFILAATNCVCSCTSAHLVSSSFFVWDWVKWTFWVFWSTVSHSPSFAAESWFSSLHSVPMSSLLSASGIWTSGTVLLLHSVLNSRLLIAYFCICVMKWMKYITFLSGKSSNQRKDIVYSLLCHWTTTTDHLNILSFL